MDELAVLDEMDDRGVRDSVSGQPGKALDGNPECRFR
jgi:hypothetical protein